MMENISLVGISLFSIFLLNKLKSKQRLTAEQIAACRKIISERDPISSDWYQNVCTKSTAGSGFICYNLATGDISYRTDPPDYVMLFSKEEMARVLSH